MKKNVHISIDVLVQGLKVIIIGLALAYILGFIVLAIIRMRYPYELEWIEGAYVDQARWILEGNFPFTPPDIHYIPTSKTPIFFYLSALLMKVFGEGFLAPRLLSTLTAIGTFILLFMIVRDQSFRPIHSTPLGKAPDQPGTVPSGGESNLDDSRSRKLQSMTGLLAAGIYAASFQFTGSWMDLAKTDSLFLFLVLLSFYLLRKGWAHSPTAMAESSPSAFPEQRGGSVTGSKQRNGPSEASIGFRKAKPILLITSGVIFTLAFMTKQLALPIALAFAPFSLIASRGRTWLTWLSAGIVGLGSFLVFENLSNGWFSFYTLDTSLQHAREADILLFWREFLSQMWPAVLLAFVYGIATLRKINLRQVWQKGLPELENIGLAAALILTSYAIYLKTWTYTNGFMPACLGIALLADLGLEELDRFTQYKKSGMPGSPRVQYPKWLQKILVRWNSRSAYLVGIVIVIIQFLILYYIPSAQLPTENDHNAATQFVDRIRALPGEVLVFNHGFFNFLADKQTYLHSAPLGDVIGSNYSEGSDTAQRIAQTKQVVDQAIIERFFDWIVIDGSDYKDWLPYYVYTGDLPEVFYPVTGVATRPEELLTRNPLAQGGTLPLNDPAYNALFITGWTQVQFPLSPENPQADEQSNANANPGRQTSDDYAIIRVAVESDYDYQLDLRVQFNCMQAVNSQTQVLTIGWNKKVLGIEKNLGCESASLSYAIPSKMIRKGFNDLWFEISHAPGTASSTLKEPASTGTGGSKPLILTSLRLEQFR